MAPLLDGLWRQDHHLSQAGRSGDEEARRYLRRRRRPGPRPTPPPGGTFPYNGIDAQVAQQRRAPAVPHRGGIARRPMRTYGTRVERRARARREAMTISASFSAPISTEAELRYLMKREWAMEADDVLWRRSKLGLRFSRQRARCAGALHGRRHAALKADGIIHDIGHSRHRPGHDLDPRHRVRRGARSAGQRAAGIPPDLSGLGLGRARSGGDLGERRCDIASALKQAGLQAKNIAAIGITNQRETTLIWDRATGKPIHNAIVWQDRRTADICRALRDAGHERDDRPQRTGLLLDPYFSATKIAWILDHVRGRARGGRGGAARLRHGRQHS